MTCSTTKRNTGASECPVEMGIIKSVMNFPFGATPLYNGDTTELLNTFLLTAVHAAEASRGAIFPSAYDVVPNISDPIFEESSIKIRQHVGDGAAEFTIVNIQDINMLPKLRSYNGTPVKSFLIDDKGQVFGLAATGGFAPIPMTVTTVNADMKGGDTISKTKSIYNFINNSDYHELMYLGTTTIPKSQLTGLSDVTLTNVGTAAAPVIKLWIDGVDVTSRYATLLTAKAAWLVKGAAPSAATVTYDAAAVGFKTFTTVTTAGDVITLVTPAALLALAVPVKYIECTPLTLS